MTKSIMKWSTLTRPGATFSGRQWLSTLGELGVGRA
jgi:hypothetical protein